MRLLIEARNRDREPIAVITGWTKLTVIPRFNAVGAWTMDIPQAGLPVGVQLALANAGGIRVMNRDEPDADPILSGPVTSVGGKWGDGDRYGGTLSYGGISDEHVLSDRITWPNPAAAWTAQSTSAYYTRVQGPAEDAIRALVDVNAGPSARDERATRGLTLTASAGRGTDVEVRTRFENLLDVARELAATGGDLGFRVDQLHNGQLRFSVYEPALRDGVLLAHNLGTATGGSSSRDAPTVTRALVAGQGEGTARILVERAAPYAEETWARRIEQLVDRRDSSTEFLLGQAGGEAIHEGAQRGTFKVTAVDGRGAVYGTDYGLGDRIAYAYGTAEQVDVVREVVITSEAGQLTKVEPVIGPGDATASPALYTKVARLERALRQLQARL